MLDLSFTPITIFRLKKTKTKKTLCVAFLKESSQYWIFAQQRLTSQWTLWSQAVLGSRWDLTSWSLMSWRVRGVITHLSLRVLTKPTKRRGRIATLVSNGHWLLWHTRCPPDVFSYSSRACGDSFRGYASQPSLKCVWPHTSGSVGREKSQACNFWWSST